MLRSFFKRKTSPLTGAPAERRLKTYTAQSGYVYEYFYEGRRPCRDGGESGVEYVFTVSAGRKAFHPVSVLVAGGALRAWEQAHGRTLSATEQYAVSKMALFQAFDERATPDLMQQAVRVRYADLASIIAALGL